MPDLETPISTAATSIPVSSPLVESVQRAPVVRPAAPPPTALGAGAVALVARAPAVSMAVNGLLVRRDASMPTTTGSVAARESQPQVIPAGLPAAMPDSMHAEMPIGGMRKAIIASHAQDVAASRSYQERPRGAVIASELTIPRQRIANVEAIDTHCQSPVRPFGTSIGMTPITDDPSTLALWSKRLQVAPQDLVESHRDGAAITQVAARRTVAMSFYAYMRPGLTDAEIMPHLSGIDCAKPVTMVTLTQGQNLYQHSHPERGPGEYFTPDATARPTDVGVAPVVMANDHLRLLPRERRIYQVRAEDQAYGLVSSAAPVVDTWSVPGSPYPTLGGTVQVVLPSRERDKVIRHDASTPA